MIFGMILCGLSLIVVGIPTVHKESPYREMNLNP